jgi:potassium-dependent mechanosensitive channel
MLKQFPAGRGVITLCWIVLLALIWIVPNLDASAQSLAATSPSADKPAGGKPTDSAAPDDEKALAELREKRQKAQAELARVESKAASTAPVGTTSDELQERHDLLEDIVWGYDEQVNELGRLRDARHQRMEVDRAVTEWKGFEDPPHSVSMVDQLWESAYALQRTVEGLEAQLNLLTLRFDRARLTLTAADEGFRQSSEEIEAAKDLEETARLRWVYDLNELRRHAAAVALNAAEVAKRRVEETLAETQTRLALTRRQLETAKAQMRFTEADLNKARARLADERQEYEHELERVLAEHRRQAQVLQDLERRRPSTPSTPRRNGKDQAQAFKAKTAVELAQLEAETLVIRSDLLRQMIEMVERERQLWESRAEIQLKEEAAGAQDAWQRLTPLANNLRASRDYLRQQLGVVSTQISELENRLRSENRREQPADQERLSLFRQREHAYNRALQRIGLTERFLERWRSEFREQWREVPWSARAREWLTQAWELILVAWSFEVFAAEDTIEVDGKIITGSRSVTIGKITIALLIFIIGYIASMSLSRLIGRVAIRRLGTTPEVGQIVRQWSQALLVTVVIVISFVFVKIPLTIFAFLGGAFAIGAGFGAQNLLKNVISGLLVLIERPLRVGDLVEVDKVRGRVSSIGLRSSTIRDAGGMETLVPNSTFLDRYLTNWTYSSSVTRFSLRLGVSYDAPSKEVRQLLTEILEEHPDVAKVPPPRVLLDDFGAAARVYNLYYWLEIRLDVDPSDVASELRIVIEEKFVERNLQVLPAG